MFQSFLDKLNIYQQTRMNYYLILTLEDDYNKNTSIFPIFKQIMTKEQNGKDLLLLLLLC